MTFLKKKFTTKLNRGLWWFWTVTWSETRELPDYEQLAALFLL